MDENKISGFENEYEFVKYLNNKKVGQVNPLFKNLLSNIFNSISDDDNIVAWKNGLPQKIDFFIRINYELRGISLKKGIKNSVHASHISTFTRFLIENGISHGVINEFLKFHYTDGTINNKGSKRLSALEYKELYQDKIDMINQEFNKKDFLEKAIEFFIYKGKLSYDSIDAIVYGTIYDFIWIKKDDILKVLISKCEKYATGVHFSNLLCQPLSRNLKYNPRYESYRHVVQIKWYSLFDDIIENMNSKVIEKCS